MANIPHASSYRGGTRRAAEVARVERITRQPIPEPKGWVIGLTLFLILVIGALVLTGHPWLGVIAAAASGGAITHLMTR